MPVVMAMPRRRSGRPADPPAARAPAADQAHPAGGSLPSTPFQAGSGGAVDLGQQLPVDRAGRGQLVFEVGDLLAQQRVVLLKGGDARVELLDVGAMEGG